MSMFYESLDDAVASVVIALQDGVKVLERIADALEHMCERGLSVDID